MEENNVYTKTEILQIAKEQLALDYNCQLSDFEKEKNTLVENNLIDGRRVYDHDGFFPAWAELYSKIKEEEEEH